LYAVAAYVSGKTASVTVDVNPEKAKLTTLTLTLTFRTTVIFSKFDARVDNECPQCTKWSEYTFFENPRWQTAANLH